VREVAKGPSMPGLPVRTQKNPACVGDDLNQGIAQQMDADPVLKKAVDEILGVTWPDLDVPVEPAAPIGGPERHVSINVVMRTGAEDALRAIDREDSDARFEFELSIREDASKEELTGYLEAARKVTATTAARRAEAAAGVMSAADAVMAKWADKGEPATGWCLQPAALGGCSGADVTYPLLPRILDDRKVLKAMPD
jgi:hypothetical protein